MIPVILSCLTLVFAEYSVQATREGLVGGRTATGHVIRKDDVFVALPARSALYRYVLVSYGGKTVRAQVLDVGPHSTNDPYWIGKSRPLAESGKRVGCRGRVKNKAGIDLSDGLWDALGIPRKKGIVVVKWQWSR